MGLLDALFGLDDNYEEGREDGSKLAKDEDEGSILEVAIDAAFNREELEKLGKSDEYKSGYDRGKETYGKKF